MYEYYLAIVLIPLAASIVAGLAGHKIGRAGAHWVTIIGVGVSFALSMLVLKNMFWGGMEPENISVYTWAVSDGLRMEVGFLVDRLTALMMVVGAATTIEGIGTMTNRCVRIGDLHSPGDD